MRIPAFRVDHPRGDKVVFSGTTAGLYAAAGYRVNSETVSKEHEN